jgi:hypothetical protein
VLFLGEGDLPKPDTLATLVGVADRTGADIVTCCVDYVEGEQGDPSAAAERWVPLGPCLGVGLFRNCYGGPSMLVRREAFLTLGGFAEDCGAGMGDREFYTKAQLAGLRHEVVPEALLWSAEDVSGGVPTATAYSDDMRSIRPILSAVPADLRNMVLLARGLDVALHDKEAELGRCKDAFRRCSADREALRTVRDRARQGRKRALEKRRRALRQWRRYEKAHRLLLNKPPVRAYRAVKRVLRALLGRSGTEDDSGERCDTP